MSDTTKTEVARGATAGGGSSRLNVNINARTASALRRISSEEHITYTEAVRRAIEVLDFLTQERREGNAIQIYDPSLKTTREIITL